MKSRIQHYPLSTSEHEWTSNIGYILFPTLFLTLRYAGTLFAYYDGNSVKIFKRIFTSRQYYISSHHNNEFQYLIEKLQKGSRVTLDIMLVHFEIYILFCICFHIWVIFGKFWHPLIISLQFFLKLNIEKKQDKNDFKPNLNCFIFLSRRNARATF